MHDAERALRIFEWHLAVFSVKQHAVRALCDWYSAHSYTNAVSD